MQENYLPWSIRVEDFPQSGSLENQLKFLIGFAILAPSGHNSQPWEFAIKNNSVEFWVNEDRALGKSDPDRRQTLISIGCALENLLLAADYYGFEYDVKYFPEDDENLVAYTSFQKFELTKNDSDHLIFSIPKRVSNRNKYSSQPIPEQFLEEVKKISSSEIEVQVITEKSKILPLSDIANQAQIEVMDRDSFREELSHYVKSNFTKSETGMPGFTLGLPTLVSLFASKLIKKVNMSRKTAKKDDTLLKKFTSAFLIVSAKSDDKYNWMKTGQIFERAWLLATQNGLSCSVLAAGVQVGNYFKKVQEILSTSLRPLVFARLWYFDQIARHSPRKKIEEVLKNDLQPG